MAATEPAATGERRLDWSAVPGAVYVHVPFCRHHCGYCDFTVVAGQDQLFERYLAALAVEIELIAARQPDTMSEPFTTLYLGGGTPTHPPVPILERLLRLCRERFPLTPDAEFTVEANPLDLTEEKLDLLAACGVNRVSLGVQSFDPAALRLLERDHVPHELEELWPRLNRRFDNVSVDLIFGVPGQSLTEWQRTLTAALALHPAHVSTYGLTFEPQTAFDVRRRRGELVPVDEDLEYRCFSAAMDQLEQAGFEHYEVSNFARSGRRSQHNQVYWRGDPYHGFGPGAARYLGGCRETNVRTVHGWLQRLERGELPIGEAETLPAEARARELIFLRLRTAAGLDREEFRQRTGYEFDELAGTATREQVAGGFLEDDRQVVRLTRAGWFVADRVVEAFL